MITVGSNTAIMQNVIKHLQVPLWEYHTSRSSSMPNNNLYLIKYQLYSQQTLAVDSSS